MNFQLIISGSSITNDYEWPTWYTWIKKRYKFSNDINLSLKGLGNEAIILRAVHGAKKVDNPFILLQLTSVDKWDWYVNDGNLVKIINKEKHKINIFDKTDQFGYWSTGSHFPLWKEHYKNNYFSIQHQMLQTLILIQWFQQLSDAQGWKYLILFDSPLLSVTEEQLNKGTLTYEQCFDNNLTNNSLCQILFDKSTFTEIYTPGLIGFATVNGLPWYHHKFKGHPGSLVHLEFAKQIVDLELSQAFTPVVEFEEFETEATRFQGLLND